MMKFFIVLVGILIVIGIIGQVLKKQNQKSVFRKTRDRLIYFSYSNAAIGLVLLFFTNELIPFLSARFWYLAWFVEMVWWLYSIIKQLRGLPKIKEQQAEEKKYKQYIP